MSDVVFADDIKEDRSASEASGSANPDSAPMGSSTTLLQRRLDACWSPAQLDIALDMPSLANKFDGLQRPDLAEDWPLWTENGLDLGPLSPGPLNPAALNPASTSPISHHVLTIACSLIR